MEFDTSSATQRMPTPTYAAQSLDVGQGLLERVRSLSRGPSGQSVDAPTDLASLFRARDPSATSTATAALPASFLGGVFFPTASLPPRAGPPPAAPAAAGVPSPSPSASQRGTIPIPGTNNVALRGGFLSTVIANSGIPVQPARLVAPTADAGAAVRAAEEQRAVTAGLVWDLATDMLHTATVPETRLDGSVKPPRLLSTSHTVPLPTAPASRPSISCRSIEDIPPDWSLKTSVRLISDAPFTWPDTLTPALRVQAFHRALRPASASGRRSAAPSTIRAEALGRIASALQYWQHPNSVLPKCQPRALRAQRQRLDDAGDAVSAGLAPRVSAWRSALQFAFHSFMSGDLPQFHVLTVDYGVVFRRLGDTCSAVLGPSTRSIRRQLLERGVTFSMPTNPTLFAIESKRYVTTATPGPLFMHSGSPSFGAGSGAAGAASADTALESTTRRGVDVPGMSAPLLFEGHWGLTGLVEFLTNDITCIMHDAMDVPLIVSDQPFKGAACVDINIVSRGHLTRSTGGTSRQSHSLVLEGYMTAAMLKQLCAAVALLQQSAPDAELLTAACTSDKITSSLNACDDAEPAVYHTIESLVIQQHGVRVTVADEQVV